MGTAPELIVVTGPVGAGKTTIAFATGMLLEEAGIPHAVVDMDALRNVYPAPEGDPFATRIGYDNLAAVWTNLRTIDPRVVMLADVVEHRHQVVEYERAVPGARVTVVRLHVPMELILSRLEDRETAATIEWYRRRAPELQAIMEREQVADVVIDVGKQSPEAIGREILRAVSITTSS